MIIILIFSLFCISTVSATTVTITGKPSAYNNLPYEDFTKTWYNFCPLCGESNVLMNNPKGTAEGELTCLECGADYCVVTGKDKHGSGSRASLILFNDSVTANIFLWMDS